MYIYINLPEHVYMCLYLRMCNYEKVISPAKRMAEANKVSWMAANERRCWMLKWKICFFCAFHYTIYEQEYHACRYMHLSFALFNAMHSFFCAQFSCLLATWRSLHFGVATENAKNMCICMYICGWIVAGVL